MAFDLVADQRLARDLVGLVEQRHGEIRHADRARVALALHLGHGAERFGQRHARVRPVDQQQVDHVEPQLRQTFLHRAFEIVRRQQRRLHLGGDHHLGALARGAHALAHFGLVAVHLRGVDVAIADADRLLDQPRAVAPAQRPGAEANDRDLESLGLNHLSIFIAHDLIRKPVPTFRDHALRRIPHRRVRRADHAHIGGVELLQFRHFGVRQFEVEHVEIFLQVRRVRRARDRAQAELHQIAQRHLRRALAMRLADALQRLGARHLAARDRHIGDHRHAVLLARRQHLVLVDEGMHLDLIADQRLAGHRPGLVQHLGGEIGDADMLGLAVLLGLAERADAGLERDVLVVPMDQQQIDIRQFEFDQALVDDFDEIVRHQVFLAHLGADQHLLALDAGVAQALAVLHLVAVEGGGVEMAVAELQRGLHRLHADVPLQGHGA